MTDKLLAALFAALTAVCSWISIPLPFSPIPLNLATLAVFLTGGLLGWKYGSLSMIIYTLMGAVGAPVFHSFTGGPGIIAGPTGGYIIGYITAAFTIGALVQLWLKKQKKLSYPMLAIFMAAGLASCYALGTLWFILSSGTGPGAALAACVVPFLPGDAVKITAGVILVKKLRPHITLFL